MAEHDPYDGEQSEGEQALDDQLRPARLDAFTGQRQIVENLKVYISASLKRGECLDHVLFCGPPGLGKTTLARIIASEMNTKIVQSSAPALGKAADLAGILTQLQEGDVLFLDEIHRLSPGVEEFLYSAMEDWVIDIVLESGGPSSRTVRIDLPRFTLVGATTKEGSMQTPFRDRFGIVERLRYYDPPELDVIIRRSAKILKTNINGEACSLLSGRCRGTPRIANRLLRRVWDLATVEQSDVIKEDMVERSLNMQGIDPFGLQEIDRRILEILYKNQGKAVGLSTLAASLSEDKSTIEDVFEPYLIQRGWVQKTAQGRVLSGEGLRMMAGTTNEEGWL